jgi:hypothetical protein
MLYDSRRVKVDGVGLSTVHRRVPVKQRHSRLPFPFIRPCQWAPQALLGCFLLRPAPKYTVAPYLPLVRTRWLCISLSGYVSPCPTSSHTLFVKPALVYPESTCFCYAPNPASERAASIPCHCCNSRRARTERVVEHTQTSSTKLTRCG